MARIEQPLVVADAGPLIHLDELASLELLADFETILIPKEVWAEVVRHRPTLALSDVPHATLAVASGDPSPQLIALSDSLALDSGERAALLLMEMQQAGLFLSDDAAARVAAESLGFAVHGTIGILIRSIRTGRRTRQQILTLLTALSERSSLHISAKLLDTVINAVKAHDRPGD